MVFLFFFLSFIALSQQIVPTINVGIILDLSPSFSYVSNSIYKSLQLAFSNHTIPTVDRKYTFVNKNVSSLDDCQSVAYFVFNQSVSMTFAYVNSACLSVIYKQNIIANSFLIVPRMYAFSDCIQNSVFSSLYIHEVVSLLTQLYGDIIILGYLNEVTISLEKLLLPSNNYNIQVGLTYHGLILYSTSTESVLKIKEYLPNGGKIISLLVAKDTNELLNEIKLQSLSDIYLYSLIDTVKDAYETNDNAIGQYLLVDDMYDIKNTEFYKLYEITYGNTDKISSIEYFTFYMVKHWIDTLDEVVFYDPQIIQNTYRSDIITPEITLYFSDNNFYYGKYYLYRVNDLNELEYINTLGIHCAIDDRAFTPVITNVTHQNLCNLEINEVKYYAMIHNYYYMNENVRIESSLDVISSELMNFYNEQNYYTLRIIENEVPDTIEELEELINNYSSIYKVDTIFGAIDSDLLIQIVPLLESLDILYFSVEENEGNICSPNVVYVNSGIYTQFHFYIAANYAIYNPPDLNRMYIIYSEGRYGDFFYELVSNEESLERYEIKYYQLKRDSSNVKEIVNILNSESNKHIILFASQGKCTIEFFKLYTGSVSLYSFISFSHSTPYKIFAFDININNFYFISIYSNEVVDINSIPFDYYYIDFNVNYTIDYRIGKHLVNNLKDSYANCASYSSASYKRCFEEFPSTIKQTSIGYNFQVMGNPNLYKIDNNKTISVFANCPFPTVSTSYNYDLSNHSFNVCKALDKILTLKSTVNVYIIFPIEESRTLDLLYSLFYLIQNMYSKNRQNVIPLIFPMHCSFTSLECYKNVFKTLKEEKAELSYLLAPFSEEFMYELEDDIKSVKTYIVNTWWYCESLCEANYVNMGDSLEQTCSGISSVLLGNDDIYTNGFYKYLKGDILYIKYKLILYLIDETNINSQLDKINTECIKSFLISTLLTTKNDQIVTDLDKSITLIMIRNDEANILGNIKEYNNTYIISTYYNDLNITQNIEIHEAIDTFSNNIEAYNTIFPFSKNNHFYFPTYLLNYYIALEYIKDDKIMTLSSPKGNVTVDDNPSTITNVFVIKIINETFILHHESSTPVKPFLYTTYDENKKIVYPEDVLNPSNLNLFVYKCSNGVLYKHDAYNSLYLYDEESLHDFVTYFGIAAASYDLISTEHIYLRIIPFTFKDNIPAITYKDQLDKLFEKFTFTSITGCYYKDCLLFFNDYLVDKDIPLISPYQSTGEMCFNNVIIGGTIISQEIMSMFYLLQKWTLPISIIIDQNNYSQTYMKMLKPYLEFFNVVHFIHNITTTDLTPEAYYYLFEKIRKDIYNGGLIVLLIDDINPFEKMVLYFYKYFYNDDNDVPFYLLVNDSPDFLYLLLSDRISYNHIYYQVNYNPRLNVEENLHYLDITKSHLGIDTLFDDNSAVAYVFIKIIYENYVKSNTTSFKVIKDTTLINSYNTAIGPIQITEDLYTAQICYLRTYDKESDKILQVNKGSGIYIPTPFSSLYHHTYYLCVNGKATEFSNIVHIGVIHPYSGYYKHKYSSVIYALTLASNYFVNFLSDDVKYVLNYYDCGDDIDTFKNILHKLVEEKYVAVFGGYPSVAVRFTISKEINNTNTSFYYLYDVDYPECYSENFIILGTAINQKIIAIAQYLDTTAIRNTILISDEFDWYLNELYDYIMKIHFMDVFSSYIFYDSSKLRLFFDEISGNNTHYAFILSTTLESTYKFYNELHQYSLLFPSFKYLVFDLKMDYFEAEQYPVELLVNNFIMSNYLPSYNLVYNTIWTDPTVFSYIKEVNISSIFYIASYLTDFYYRRSHSVYKNNFIYYSPEGFVILDKSNYLSRQIRIGKFYNDSNKIGVKLEFESTGLKPDPYYLYFYKELRPIVCNVYSDDKPEEVIIKKIIYLNDNSDNIFDIYTGLHYVLTYENHNILLNTDIIDSDIKLNINDIRKFAQDENVIAFMGCTTIDCIMMIMPILTQYNKVLFSFFGDPGICSSNVITTVNSRINQISTVMNHFYARNINHFILLTESNNNVYSNMFRSYSKILGIESIVIENPSLLSIKDYLDKLLHNKVLVYNTISLLNPSIFNFLSSKSEDNVTFATTNLYYNYYYNSSYYIVNVYSVEYFVIEIDEVKMNGLEDGFEEGFYKIYNRLPNQYNYIGYNAMVLLFKMIKSIGNFDILSNLNKIDSIISRYLTTSNPLFLIKAKENKQVELIKIYNSTIESYSTPYPWFLESLTGSICVIDFDNKTAITKKIGINRIGLTFNVNEDSEMVYTRQTVLTIVNAINYYYLTNDLNVVTMTYNCKTEDDFRNAYTELMKYSNLRIIIGYNEYELVEEYIKNTNVLFFSIHPIPECLISKNMFSSASENQIIYPVVEYVTNKQIIEDIIVIYSSDVYVIINQLKERFQNYIITYYYVDDDDYKKYIDKFMSEYVISINTINMICLLHKNILRYFANSLCSINDELKSSINAYYCDAMTYALKDISTCSSGVKNYIVGTYNKDIIKENIDTRSYIFSNNVTEILINNYYTSLMSQLPFNEEAFVGLIFVEFIKFLFLFDTNSLDTLPIYSNSFPTPYGTISMSVTNTVSRTIYYTHFQSTNSLISSNLLRTYEMCYKYNKNTNQYDYVDYYNSERTTEYLKNVDVFPIAVIFESPIENITFYERAFYVSIERLVISINNGTGLMNKFMYLEQFYYKDIISTFSSLKTTIFFSIMDYSLVSKYFLPLLYLTNRIILHLLPFSGEVCENNVIFMNYFPYEIGYHVTNFIINQNKNLLVIYSITYSDFIVPLYNQLYNYPYTSVITMSFDIKDKTTFTPIHEYVNKTDDAILLLFGPILHIDGNIFKTFIDGFKPDKNTIITDLSTLQIDYELINQLNGFYFFSSYFQCLGNESSINSNINYAVLAEELNSFYYKIFSRDYRIEYPSYIGVTSFLILKDILNRAGKYELNNNFFKVLNQKISVLSPYGQSILTPGRKLEQLYFIGRYNSKINNYDIKYYQDTSLFPYNFDPYLSDQKCLFNVNNVEYNSDQIKLLFIFADDQQSEIGIDAFLAFLYQLNEINNADIYKNNYVVYTKKYNTVDELKVIVTENQENYFAYITYIQPTHLEQIRYDFNKTILFSLTSATKEVMLQSNIISFSLVDSVAIDIINDQLDKLYLDNVLLISMPNCPIYLFLTKLFCNKSNS